MSEYAPRRRGKADADPPAPPPPPTCAACRHWRPKGEHDARPVGLCVADPPAHIRAVTLWGPLCVYPVTESQTPACGRLDPL